MELDQLILDFEIAQSALSNAIEIDDQNFIKERDNAVEQSFQSLLDFVPESVDAAVRLTKVLINAIPGTEQSSEVTQAIQKKLLAIVENAGTYPSLSESESSDH